MGYRTWTTPRWCGRWRSWLRTKWLEATRASGRGAGSTSLERRTVWLPPPAQGLETKVSSPFERCPAHRRLAPPQRRPGFLRRRSLRCLGLVRRARSAKPIGALGPGHRLGTVASRPRGSGPAPQGARELVAGGEEDLHLAPRWLCAAQHTQQLVEHAIRLLLVQDTGVEQERLRASAQAVQEPLLGPGVARHFGLELARR